jgi:hypothetical protein
MRVVPGIARRLWVWRCRSSPRMSHVSFPDRHRIHPAPRSAAGCSRIRHGDGSADDGGGGDA